MNQLGKELENREESFILSKSNSSKKSFLVYGLLLFLWGFTLIFLFMGGISQTIAFPITISVLLFSFSIFVAGIKMMIHSGAEVRGNTVFDFHSHLWKSQIDTTWSTIAFMNFSVLFILIGIYVKFPFAIGGTLFFTLFLIGFVSATKEFNTKRKVAKQFAPSEIKLEITDMPKIGVYIHIEFNNPTLILEQKTIHFVVRFLKERSNPYIGGSEGETHFKFKTYVNFEEIEMAILENGKATTEFMLPIVNGHYANNFDFQQPDYWELQVSEKETGLLTRFVLE